MTVIEKTPKTVRVIASWKILSGGSVNGPPWLASPSRLAGTMSVYSKKTMSQEMSTTCQSDQPLS